MWPLKGTPKSATPFPLDHTVYEDKLGNRAKRNAPFSRSEQISDIPIQEFKEAL